ncbi:MAG: UbiD family decarboxylase [Thermoplasmata archaeon]|jgi:UbiD family decarboxylase
MDKNIKMKCNLPPMYRKILESLKNTVVINERVGKDLELTRYLLKYPRNPVYFKDLDGYEAAGNVWADRKNFEIVLKTRDLIYKIAESINEPEDYSIVDGNFLKTADFSLRDLPIPRYFRGDGSNYITSGIVFSEYGNKRNVSFHRFMVLDQKRAAIRLVPRDLYRMYNDAMSHGEELKISVVVGAFPTFLIAAATSVEYSVDESRIASSLRKRTLGEREKMVMMDNGILVPYESEYVFSGVITSEKCRREGPFLDITRTYDVQENQPIVVFDTLYTSRDPIFHILLPGGYEHYNLMGMPREPTIYNEIRKEGIDVIDVRLTYGGNSWLHAAVKIKKRNSDDGKRAIMAAFRGHRSLKHVVIVDEDIDIGNVEDVEWAIATRFQADRDLVIIKERGSSLDPSRYENDITSKMGLDATIKGEREKFIREF